MTLVTDNPKGSTEKWLGTIGEFSQIIGNRPDKTSYIPKTVLQSLMTSKMVSVIPLIIYFMSIYLATTT